MENTYKNTQVPQSRKTAVMQRFLCWLGFHKNYKWQPYPESYSECKVDRCKYCDYYEWR